MQNPNRARMRSEDIRQSAIRLRGFIKIAATQYYAFLSDPLHHLVVPNEAFHANAFSSHLDEPALRGRPRHDPTRSVHRGKKCFTRRRRVHAFHDDGVIAHASADETFLRWERRRRAFAYDPVSLSAMFLLPGKVVMVVNFLYGLCAQNSAHDMPCHSFTTGISVTARDGYWRDIIL